MRPEGHNKTRNGCKHSYKNKPLRTWALRPKGHKKQGMAADIPKNKPLRASQVRPI